MLKSLNIENIAVIEKSSIEFNNGLNVLTGETGAGKSIVVDSINAILGERTTRELVRANAENGTVSAFFCDVQKSVLDKLFEYSIPTEDDGSLLITRAISANGKSTCKVNGSPVTVSILKEIGKLLVNIHGQHDSQALLNADAHYQFIDMMIENSHYENYYKSFKSLIETRRKLKALENSEDEKEHRAGVLRYQIAEIENADLKIGEMETLHDLRTTMQNSEVNMTSLENAFQYMNGNDDAPGVYLLFEDICKQISDAERYDHSLTEMLKKMYDTLYQIEEYKDFIFEKKERADFQPEELEKIEERVDLISRLTQKYNTDESGILTYLESAKNEFDSIKNSEEQLEMLHEKYNQELLICVSFADKLSQARKSSALRFEKSVKDELAFLDMPKTDFKVNFEKGKLGLIGYDVIEFLISTNPGEPLKGLNKIASGGELSRIMLAIKNIVAKNDTIGTLIFDEIDTGVSGNASQKIGMKLKSVSKECQVVCVTHSAQIASFADQHLLILKSVKNDRTYTKVDQLSFEEKVSELARIIGGNNATETLRLSAEEMLKKNLEDNNNGSF